MGELYFEYAKFLLEKLEKNIDIFNAGALPKGEVEGQGALAEDMYEDDSDVDNQSEVKSENNVNAGAKEDKEEDKKEDNNDQPLIVEND